MSYWRRSGLVAAMATLLFTIITPVWSAPIAQGASPLFTFSPTSLVFGTVPVGATSASQSITVTNVSGGTLFVVGSGGATTHFGGISSCNSVTLPAGGTCELSYAFAPTVVGPVTENATGSLDNQTFSLPLTGVGGPGVAFTSPPKTTALVSQAFSFAVTTVAGPDEPVITASTLPTGLTITDHGNGTATIAGTPMTTGTFPVTLTATASEGTAAQSLSITVSPDPFWIAPSGLKSGTSRSARPAHRKR